MIRDATLGEVEHVARQQGDVKYLLQLPRVMPFTVVGKADKVLGIVGLAPRSIIGRVAFVGFKNYACTVSEIRNVVEAGQVILDYYLLFYKDLIACVRSDNQKDLDWALFNGFAVDTVLTDAYNIENYSILRYVYDYRFEE